VSCDARHTVRGLFGVTPRSVGRLISAIVGGMEAIMTVKHLVGIAIAAVVAIASAGAVGIGAVEHSATQVLTKRLTPSKAEFRLNDHQRLRKMLLGQEQIVPLR
jgi:uncharacterized protein (DUF697 family)